MRRPCDCACRAVSAAWSELHAAASAPYLAAGRFAYHFARGKLGRDPVFRYLVAQGLLQPSHARETVRLLDIGSGQSLLASLTHAMAVMQRAGTWPATWPAPPRSVHYTGIELMPRDVERARKALRTLPIAPTLLCANMCDVDYPDSDVVVILDVLHYVDIQAQDAVLARVHHCLAPGGRLLLRVGDQDSRGGFAASQWVDRVVTTLRGHRAPPTWGRPLSAWTSRLEAIGFGVTAVPKSEGTPFANVLLVAQKATS